MKDDTAKIAGWVVAVILAIALLVVWSASNKHSTATASDTSSDPQSQIDELQSQLDDTNSCINEAKTAIDDLHSSIDNAHSASGGSADEMQSALDDLSYSSTPTCLE